MGFTFDTFVMIILALSVVTANILILLVMFSTDQLTHVNKYFMTSLTVADLLIGLLVAPFSIWTSLFNDWIFGERFCDVEAYLAAVLWIGSVYSLMCISIDHYVAIREPDRYAGVLSRTRSLCWVVFVWAMSLSFCCPILFGVTPARYYQQSYLCIININPHQPYFTVSGLLIFLPIILGITISIGFIFTAEYRQTQAIHASCKQFTSRTQLYLVNCVVCLVLLGAWLPWCMLQLSEQFQTIRGGHSAPQQLHFYFMWLAVANSFWKILVYISLSNDFRIGFICVITKCSCSCKNWKYVKG